MTHVSRKKLPLKSAQYLNDALIHTLSNLKPAEVKKIINSLFTKTEVQMLSKRLGIIHLLKENVEAPKIAEATKTTNQTVSRIRLQLHEVSDEYKNALYKKLKSWKNIKLLKEFLAELNEKFPSKSKVLRKIRPF
jgi:uncharacterized protein YerC